MKYKVGDKVRIREDLEPGKQYGGLTLLRDYMTDQRGKTGYVTKICFRNWCLIDITHGYLWSEEMLEPIKNFNSLE